MISKMHLLNSGALLLCSAVLLTSAATQDYTNGTKSVKGVKTCPEGYELIIDDENGKYECQCLPFHLYWPEDGLCYREYSRGPCPPGHRLVYDAELEKPQCQCPTYWSKWKDGSCYQEYTRGPCDLGQLFLADYLTGESHCVCSPNMTMHFHAPSQSCYELYTEGPCPDGHIIRFDYRFLRPECSCKDGYIKWVDGKCYQVNSVGPCVESSGNGNNTCEVDGDSGTMCFVRSLETLKMGCHCLKGTHIVQENGEMRCFEPYTRGPCQYGEWLLPGGTCERKPECQRFDHWFFWEAHRRCYRQFTQGPCQKEQLFHLNVTTGQAECTCQPQWTPYYWQKDGGCYEQDSHGPCPDGQYFSFNHTSGKTECSCFRSHVLNPTDGTCIEKFTQGPCDEGHLVVSDKTTGALTCACDKDDILLSPYYHEHDGRCYQHHSQGPCAVGELFKPDSITGKPSCVKWFTTGH